MARNGCLLFAFTAILAPQIGYSVTLHQAPKKPFGAWKAPKKPIFSWLAPKKPVQQSPAPVNESQAPPPPPLQTPKRMALDTFNAEVTMYRDVTWGSACCDMCALYCAPTKALMTKVMNFTDHDKQDEIQSYLPFVLAAQEKYPSIVDMFLDGDAAGGVSQSWLEAQANFLGGQRSFDLADSNKDGFLSYDELQDYWTLGISMIGLFNVSKDGWDVLAHGDWGCINIGYPGRTSPAGCSQLERDDSPHHLIDISGLMCLEGALDSLEAVKAKMTQDDCSLRGRWVMSSSQPGTCASVKYWLGSAPPENKRGTVAMFFGNNIVEDTNWKEIAYHTAPNMYGCWTGNHSFDNQTNVAQTYTAMRSLTAAV